MRVVPPVDDKQIGELRVRLVEAEATVERCLHLNGPCAEGLDFGRKVGIGDQIDTAITNGPGHLEASQKQVVGGPIPTEHHDDCRCHRTAVGSETGQTCRARICLPPIPFQM